MKITGCPPPWMSQEVYEKIIRDIWKVEDDLFYSLLEVAIARQRLLIVLRQVKASNA